MDSNASHSGMYCARLVSRHAPRVAITVDCGLTRASEPGYDACVFTKQAALLLLEGAVTSPAGFRP